MSASDPFRDPLFPAVASRAGAAFALLALLALWREQRRRRFPEERSLILPVTTAIVVVSVFLLALFAGGIGLIAFAGATGLVAVREYAQITRLERRYSALVAAWLVGGLSAASAISAQWLPLLPVGLFATVTLVPIVSGRVAGAHQQVGGAVFCYLYIGLPLAYMVFIRSSQPWGLRFLLAVCAAVWLSDMFGYIVGTMAKGPKLAPMVSPGKTWSGAIGSVAGAVLGVAVMQATIPLSFPLAELLPLAAVTAVCAIWSDLIESFIKRDFGVKDAGSILPGFGGVLDRFDSLLITVPIAYYTMLGLRHLTRLLVRRWQNARVPRSSRAVFALGGVGCAIVAAVGCGSLKQIGAGAHTSPANVFTITARVTAIVVNGGAANITVTGSARGTILVSQQSSYSTTPPATARRVDGTTLTLSYTCAAQLVCGVAYDLQVPRGVAVTAASRAGSITLTSLAGPVRAQTTAGLITALDLASPSAVLRSAAGGIDATFSAAPASVQASTNVGPITVNVPGSASYKIDTHTYVGSSTVTVRRNAASPHVISASSDLGSITINPS